jgi:MazG family protein
MVDPRVSESLVRLVGIMARLRAPGGCPWDREQSWDTLRPYLLEETHEVLDALARNDAAAVCEELGDLLLQIVFQAEIAAEAGLFTIADVATGIADKLVRRHPHVFGDVVVRDADEVVRNWQEIKAAERRARGREIETLDEIPSTLPALARAEEVGRKAKRIGYDWPALSGVLAKVREEMAELEAATTTGDDAAATRELGDLLLTLTSVARHLDCSAEMALRDATDRLRSRLARCDAAARAQGITLAALGPAERDRLWEEAKRSD